MRLNMAGPWKPHWYLDVPVTIIWSIWPIRPIFPRMQTFEINATMKWTLASPQKIDRKTHRVKMVVYNVHILKVGWLYNIHVLSFWVNSTFVKDTLRRVHWWTLYTFATDHVVSNRFWLNYKLHIFSYTIRSLNLDWFVKWCWDDFHHGHHQHPFWWEK